jgi:hypothetical protein
MSVDTIINKNLNINVDDLKNNKDIIKTLPQD